MLCRLRLIALLACWLLPTVVVAQDQSLPQVLIIGDSIYQQPSAEVSKALKGKVKVVFAAIQPGEVRNTQTVLNQLDQLLKNQSWDVIHFNLGLGDLVYRAPGMNSFRVMPIDAGGVRATSPAQYEQNLDQLVKRLQSGGAKLIWASTTPIRHSGTKLFVKGSEIEYNAIAEKVMRRHGVAINEMYGFVKDLIDMDKPASHNADPFFFDRKPIHQPIVDSVCNELGLSL
ncbi:hypothetical protein SV7mr_52780 [Stieleria bergensis]|uniref:GDSL-like Lipase/Acylhydrolase n=1 Tax=Stieleria bergensis TaxID=2528025 RepID=A0A517T2W5_9BACT|nr:hypothetical protein SV7mr_52780 [Planctomycetes bacterium SV_7m_r]